MPLNKIVFATLISALLFINPSANAEETQITVRVISKGAKFLGSSMGGARITIRAVDTGELLATGVTSGSTGSTTTIMQESQDRGDAVSDPKAGRFDATLQLDEPTLVEISAFGPLAQRQSANRVRATQWIVPGKHITGGDGFLLEMPGFNVDVLWPPTHIKLKGAPQEIELRANVTMMCGCPLEPGGLWDSSTYEVAARIKHNGDFLTEIPLLFAGEKSQFKAVWKASEPGIYEAIVYAYDPATGNTGLDRVTFLIK